MENTNARNFEVRITDISTGEEKYVGLSNCIFLASCEDFGTRLIRLSHCDIMTKAACYSSVKFGLEDTLKDEPILDLLLQFISSEGGFVVKEDA